jgi:hypothetical protein
MCKAIPSGFFLIYGWASLAQDGPFTFAGGMRKCITPIKPYRATWLTRLKKFSRAMKWPVIFF